MLEIYRLELPVPFPITTVNVYVVKGETLTLIDTGAKTEEGRNALIYQLKEIGYTISDIENVILTHHHADHCGLLNDFSDDVEIIGHPWNEPWITQNPGFAKQYDAFFKEFLPKLGIPNGLNKETLKETLTYSCKRSLTHGVREGETIPALPGFSVIETPGHASTHIALYRESDGLLIGGDVLLERTSSNPIIEPPYHGETERTKSLLQYNKSLRRLTTMPISRIKSGHGEDITDVKGLVEKRLHRQESRANKVFDMLKERPMTAFEVCMNLFPAVYDKQLALTISETIGQLDFLEYTQQIRVDSISNQWLYYAK